MSDVIVNRKANIISLLFIGIGFVAGWVVFSAGEYYYESFQIPVQYHAIQQAEPQGFDSCGVVLSEKGCDRSSHQESTDKTMPLSALYDIANVWRTKPTLFLRALLDQEQGLPENPLNITHGFLVDAAKQLGTLPSDHDLSNMDDCYLLIVAYADRNGMSDASTYDIARLFRAGKYGMQKANAMEYASRVCNLIVSWGGGLSTEMD